MYFERSALSGLAPPLPVTMPALLERPKLSNAMARALHKHIMRERERKRQEEEEVDKMMEQKLKEEEERKRTKEIEERMSLEETKEQVMKMEEKLQGLQEEKHQLFLQLKKVLHEEEKRRRKEQRYRPVGMHYSLVKVVCFTRVSSFLCSDITTLTSASYQPSLSMHTGQHLLSIPGSPVSHSRPGALLGERSKQLFPASVIPTRHYQTPGFSSSSAEHGQFSGSQGVHEPYGMAASQHPSTYAPGPSVPVSFASSSQIRGASAFQAMQYLPHQQTGYPVHSHFPSQPGFISGASIPLQKQLEHANQQSGFTDAGALRPMHPSAMHPSASGLLPTPMVQIPTAKAPFQSSPQGTPRHSFLAHSQSGQRFYHHSNCETDLRMWLDLETKPLIQQKFVKQKRDYSSSLKVALLHSICGSTQNHSGNPVWTLCAYIYSSRLDEPKGEAESKNGKKKEKEKGGRLAWTMHQPLLFLQNSDLEKREKGNGNVSLEEKLQQETSVRRSDATNQDLLSGFVSALDFLPQVSLGKLQVLPHLPAVLEQGEVAVLDPNQL
ncbi:hypothetical protein CCH79_00012965 [Gambusia affinis]|uniref:G protein pathway suppressor 2 n=1 Tax=Gambusia affinis TaxID=33528 RepID=A0A315VYT5_GAMAF|nr:hypothetical protein CCH79_00012965 [Gambusia affinis]